MPFIDRRSLCPFVLAASIFSVGLPASLLLAQEAQPAPTVLVQTATQREIHPEFAHPGVIEAENKATIRPLVTAQIIGNHVVPGAIVEKGELLFELDDRDFRSNLLEAEAALAVARAQVGERQLEFERKQTLVSRETAAQSELDLATAQLDAAKAQVQAAQAAVERAGKALEDTKIYAPFEGRISAANYGVGDVVSPNNPIQPEPLAEIVALDPIYVLGYLSQQVYDLFIQRRDRMQAAGTAIPKLELTLELPSGQIYPGKGRFVSWDFQAAATRGSIAARAEFPNPDGVLLPGMNVTLRGNAVEAINAVTVPQRAVGQDQQGHYVLTVGDEGKVIRNNIEVGIRDGADWTVISGLEDGANVIVEGLQKVREGQEVETQPFKQ
ncbi:efflux RND transporter periplasmic adaptor subunit [Paracoccus sp. MBLB3053]|uniref:Efflux RND transporter periplasmic adaptor subunit n=1 Tax=Paracoccus aurantius TaxID=3073814 RepID=A0ABU2HWR9_9RHOB|nr:efflux RND transporter periplasmic adaptor subunit [Paracoccus sp. MBLB3053]MDS9469499.1 efflux RND transporter periplasmic adaptor subunit [Paracoccus sp. MBLB3053]